MAMAVVVSGLMMSTLPPYPLPTSKRIIRQMDDVIISKQIDLFDWPTWSEAMEPFWTPDLVYDSVYGIGKFTGLKAWFEGEHTHWNRAFDNVAFNQLLFIGENASSSTTTYATARWYGELAGMPPTGRPVRVRICDFYRLEGERISYNWMMLDLPDVLRQAGRRVLPEAPLRDDGWFQPPRAMDGVPAPYSPLTNPATSEASRAAVTKLLDHDWFERSGGGGFGSGGGGGEAASPLWARDMIFYGPSGVGYASGRAEYERHVLGAVRCGLHHRSFALDVLSCEGHYCAAHGRLDATHAGCFLGEAATQRQVSLRLGLHWHVVDGLAIEGYLMIDAPALFAQLGIELLNRTAAPPPCARPLLVGATGAAVPAATVPATAAAAAAAATLTAPIAPAAMAVAGREGAAAAAGSAAAAPSAVVAVTTASSAVGAAFSNECLLQHGDALQPPTQGAPTTFLDECPAWVVRTTDAVWRPGIDAASVNASLEEYFYEGWRSVSSFGREYQGMAALKDLVWGTKRAFPDLQIHITDVFCTGNDVDGYKTAMPDVLTGTNTGPSAFGPPTGRKVTYNGVTP